MRSRQQAYNQAVRMNPCSASCSLLQLQVQDCIRILQDIPYSVVHTQLPSVSAGMIPLVGWYIMCVHCCNCCPATCCPAHSPLDFTFVCPTEITAFSDRIKEFEAINCNVSAFSGTWRLLYRAPLC
jgi:hypothetical protein